MRALAPTRRRRPRGELGRIRRRRVAARRAHASFGLSLPTPKGADETAALLRSGSPAVVCRFKDGRLLADILAVSDEELPELADQLRAMLDMKHGVVGVIGHVDHGKTALVRALTGQETDRLPEEKERGISIALGFAHLHAGGDGEIDLIDMPGHERFVRTMIGGATGIDAVLLVVAANEGVMPQTIEHVDIAGLLGIRTAVIAITKADLASHGEAAVVADEAAKLARTAGLAVTHEIVTSTRDGRGLDRLRDALASSVARADATEPDGIPYLPIDRAFSVAGHGPVVSGTLRGGAMRTGAVLELLPDLREVRVKAIQVRGEPTTHALPGQRTALNLRGVEIAELARGMALAPPAMLALSNWMTTSIRALHTAAPLRNGARLLALLGASQYDVRLRLLDRDVLEAGESGIAQLHFATPVASPAREHVILRQASPPSTVAGGVILDPRTVRQRRNDAAMIERLQRLAGSAPAASIAAEVHGAGGAGSRSQGFRNCRASRRAGSPIW